MPELIQRLPHDFTVVIHLILYKDKRNGKGTSMSKSLSDSVRASERCGICLEAIVFTCLKKSSLNVWFDPQYVGDCLLTVIRRWINGQFQPLWYVCCL